MGKHFVVHQSSPALHPVLENATTKLSNMSVESFLPRKALRDVLASHIRGTFYLTFGPGRCQQDSHQVAFLQMRHTLGAFGEHGACYL